MKEIAMVFFGGFALVMALIGAMHFLRRRFPAALTEQQQNTMIGPFSFIATLYAFLVGFVVVTLWHDFTEAGQIVAREAETIAVLHRLSDGLPGGNTVQKTVLEYAGSVREDEWPAMAEGMTSKKTEAIYERLWEEGRAVSPTSVREQVLHSKFIDELSSLSRHRRERIILNERGLPGVLWGALLIGGLLLLVGLFFLSISTTRVQILVDVMVIGMLLIMFYLAVEFGGPFRGDVRVSPRPLETVENTLIQQQR